MRKLLTHLPSYAALLLGVSLSMFNYAQADTLTLTESQIDGIKCTVEKDPDGIKSTVCYQNPKGSYSATAKLSAATFEEKGITIDQITEDTELGITIGVFEFSGTLSSPDITKYKHTNTSMEGTWIDRLCTKYNANDECIKSSYVTYGTVKITASSTKGATISIAGKWDAEGNGQQILTTACEANGAGVSKATEEIATITVGNKTISWPIDVTCNVKTSSKTDKNGDSYDLTNMNIKAKLAP